MAIHAAVGEDELKRMEVLKRLRARMEQEDDLSFDFDEFDGESCTGPDIVAACETVPFIAQRRLVVAKNAEKLKKADLEALAAYAQAPAEFAVLAISASKLAKNTKLYKAIAALGKAAIIDCALPKGKDLQKKVVSMAQAQGLRMTDVAAQLLIDCIGTDTVFLENEIEKMALACAQGGVIDDKAVREYVEATVEVKPWKFLEPFSERNVAASLAWLSEARGVSVYSLTSLCAGRIQELICVKCLEAKGQSGRLASELGLSSAESWKIKNHSRYARKFSLQELREALIELRNTEKVMKSSDDAEGAFSLWVLKTLS